MNQIEDLPQGQFMVGIAQGNLIGQAALGQRVGKGGTHGARANNHHLSRFPRFIIHFCSSVVGQIVFINENVKPLPGRGNENMASELIKSIATGRVSPESFWGCR
jgi:hypothetical protein